MTKFSIRLLALMLLSCVGASAQQTAPDLKGTWSGTFVSRNADISPFTITVKINKDLSGHLIGESSLVSDCLDSHHLQITLKNSNVELAGSDEKGDSVTFSGTVDNSGTLLSLHYIINGRILRLIPGHVVVMSWSATTWGLPKDAPVPESELVLTFRKTAEGAEIQLMQANVPDLLGGSATGDGATEPDAVNTNWYYRYWEPMRKYFAEAT